MAGSAPGSVGQSPSSSTVASVSLAIYSDATTETIARIGAASRLTVLVGAGASVPSGLPDWPDLIVRLLIQRGLIDDETVARSIVAAQDVRIAAQAVFPSDVNQAERAAAVRLALWGDSTDAVPSSLHRAVARLVRRRPPGAVQLLTLNYDDLLERALIDDATDHGDQARTTAPRFDDEIPDADDVVEHLHGVLPRDETDQYGEIVLTQADYNNAASGGTWRDDSIDRALDDDGLLVLVGTSLIDPNLLRWTARLEQHHHAADRVIALLPRQAYGYPAGVWDRAGDLLRSQWADLGVTAVLLDSFADVGRCIDLIDSSLEPIVVAQSVLGGAHSNFENFQEIAPDLLQHQLARLTGYSGEFANLTLWLLDPTLSFLQRWAAHDRRFLLRGNLRRIEAEWDHPRVASLAFTTPEHGYALTSSDAHADSREHYTTGRWGTIAAAVVTSTPEKPTVPVGVLTVATAAEFEQAEQADLVEALTLLAAEWTDTLSNLAPGAGVTLPS